MTTTGSPLAEGDRVLAFYAGEHRRCFIERYYPGSQYHLLRLLDEPHRAPFVIHQDDIKPEGVCNPPSH